MIEKLWIKLKSTAATEEQYKIIERQTEEEQLKLLELLEEEI